jgi:hypothetical protein
MLEMPGVIFDRIRQPDTLEIIGQQRMARGGTAGREDEHERAP